jgi:hypothetical protein
MATARIFAKATPEQRQELYDLERHPRTPKSALWRIQIITLSLNNISATEIEKITRHTMKTVLRIIHGFNANGLEALFERDHLGRTARFTQEMENFVLELVRGELPQNAVKYHRNGQSALFQQAQNTPNTGLCVLPPTANGFELAKKPICPQRTSGCRRQGTGSAKTQ